MWEKNVEVGQTRKVWNVYFNTDRSWVGRVMEGRKLCGERIMKIQQLLSRGGHTPIIPVLRGGDGRIRPRPTLAI